MEELTKFIERKTHKDIMDDLDKEYRLYLLKWRGLNGIIRRAGLKERHERKRTKKMLDKYPDDMEILNGRMSDYALVDISEWKVVRGVQTDDWVMRSHLTMSEENRKKEKEYLYLEGN